MLLGGFADDHNLSFSPELQFAFFYYWKLSIHMGYHFISIRILIVSSDFMHIATHTCIFACIHSHTYTHTHAHRCTHTHARMRTHTHTHTHTCIHACTHYKDTCTHVRMHPHMHTCTCPHRHTPLSSNHGTKSLLFHRREVECSTAHRRR